MTRLLVSNNSRFSRKFSNYQQFWFSSQSTSFHHYYCPSQYSPDRWYNSLYPSLLKPIRYCAIINKYSDINDRNKLLGINQIENAKNVCYQFLKEYPYGYYHSKDDNPQKDMIGNDHPVNSHNDDNNYPWPSPNLTSSLDRNNLSCYYPLDGASIFPILALNLQPTSQVFDMCAAPGGKSLIILSYLDLLAGGKLTCCDISISRRQRLSQTLQNYLPSNLLKLIPILSGDASLSKFYYHNQLYSKFDRILVDAPCSSDRHLIQSLKLLNQWSVSKIKTNIRRQYQLLYHACIICSIPGRIVYSTCSINIHENDQIIEKIIKKLNKKFQNYTLEDEDIPTSDATSTANTSDTIYVPYLTNIDASTLQLPYGEKTKYGWIILPDQCNGMGPIYFSIIDINYQPQDRKVNHTKRKVHTKSSRRKLLSLEFDDDDD